MRKDLIKIVYDGHSNDSHKKSGTAHPLRKAKKFKLSADLEVTDNFCRPKIGTMSKRFFLDSWDAGEHNVNWNVTEKVLRSQVGKPWNDVYSELCEILKEHSRTCTNFILKNLTWWVDFETVIEDGVVLSKPGYSGDRHPVVGLYTHPVTGILSFAEKQKRLNRWKAGSMSPNVRKVKDFVYHVYHKEIWWRVATRNFYPNDWLSPWRDVLTGETEPYRLRSFYGSMEIGYTKRQLSRKEMKQAGLWRSK